MKAISQQNKKLSAFNQEDIEILNIQYPTGKIIKIFFLFLFLMNELLVGSSARQGIHSGCCRDPKQQ